MPTTRTRHPSPRRHVLANDVHDDAIGNRSPLRMGSLHDLRWWVPVGAVLAALPWAWFAVRDRYVVGELVAIVLPVAFPALAGLAAVTSVVLAAPRNRWGLWSDDRWPSGRRVAIVLIVLAVSIAAMVVTAVRSPWTTRVLPAPVGTSVRLIVANVLEDNAVQDAAAAKLLALDGDIVVTAETTSQVHDALTDAYPHAEGGHRAWREATSDHPGNDVEHGIGVYSRHPLTVLPDPRELEVVDFRVVRTRVEVPDGPFVLYALHLPKPGLRSTQEIQANPAHFDRIIEVLRQSVLAEELPVVVAGDLNATDRGRGYRRLTGGSGDGPLRDAMRVEPTGPTSVKVLWRPLFLRIDHVLLSHTMCAADPRRVAMPGSDHHGLMVRVGLCQAGNGSAMIGMDDRT